MLTGSHLDLITLGSICLLGAMSPGPSLFVILGVAGQSGKKAGVAAAWGHAVGVGFWAMLSLSSWGLLTQSAPAWIRELLTTLACLYLLFLAFRIGFAAYQNQITNHSNEVPTSQSAKQSMRKHALTGLSIAIANPKLLLFFIAIYPQVIPSMPSMNEKIIAVITPLFIDGLWYHGATLTSERLGLIKLLHRYQRTTLALTAFILLILVAQTFINSSFDWSSQLPDQ